MKKVFLLFLLSIFTFCTNGVKKEYYDNGNLMNEFTLVEGKFEGAYKHYYESGELRELHHYSNGEKADSSLYYKKDGSLVYSEYYSLIDSLEITYRKYFYDNGLLKSEGFYYNSEHPVGKWKNYNEEEGFLEEIKEIKNIDGKPHLNQKWVFNSKGDTLFEKSVYLDILFSKDTITLDEAIKGYAVLEQPLFKDKQSSIKVITPKDFSPDFKNDFSDVNEIARDTTFNFNLETEYRAEAGLPDGDYRNQAVFGRYYKSEGPKTFRGIVVEYYHLDTVNLDSINYFEHKFYFEKEVYVKSSHSSK